MGQTTIILLQLHLHFYYVVQCTMLIFRSPSTLNQFLIIVYKLLMHDIVYLRCSTHTSDGLGAIIMVVHRVSTVSYIYTNYVFMYEEFEEPNSWIMVLH